MRLNVAIAITVFLAFFGNANASDLDIDGDTDRTGVIEGSATEDGLEATSSVLVLCNCDRDNPNPVVGIRRADNFDDKINGATDKLDLGVAKQLLSGLGLILAAEL